MIFFLDFILGSFFIAGGKFVATINYGDDNESLIEASKWT
jgi:hypothetical protein